MRFLMICVRRLEIGDGRGASFKAYETDRMSVSSSQVSCLTIKINPCADTVGCPRQQPNLPAPQRCFRFASTLSHTDLCGRVVNVACS
jgi:hypothetical protein